MTTDQTEPSCGRGCHSIEQGCPVHDPDTPEPDTFNDVMAVIQSRAISLEDAWAVLATAETRLTREAKAAAWDEGFDAGHQAARAVNPEWPEQPTNPYRAALATGTTTNQEADQ